MAKKWKIGIYLDQQGQKHCFAIDNEEPIETGKQDTSSRRLDPTTGYYRWVYATSPSNIANHIHSEKPRTMHMVLEWKKLAYQSGSGVRSRWIVKNADMPELIGTTINGKQDLVRDAFLKGYCTQSKELVGNFKFTKHKQHLIVEMP